MAGNFYGAYLEMIPSDFAFLQQAGQVDDQLMVIFVFVFAVPAVLQGLLFSNKDLMDEVDEIVESENIAP